jgi:MFS family permease
MPTAAFAPLRHRNFALALGSNFVSSTGTWMQSVALGVYLTERTHNPIWLGLLTLAGWGPAIIGSPLGGLVADRRHRQSWIQMTNLVMAATATALAVLALASHLTPTEAVSLEIIEGLFGAAAWPAWQSLLPDLVERDEVLAATSLSSAQFNLGRILGPLAAGVALALGSPGVCFAVNAASFIVVVVAFAFVRTPPRAAPEGAVRPLYDLAAGARQAWRVRGCRYPILGVVVIGLTVSPFITLVPVMAIEVLHGGRVGTSWLVTAQGVGAVLGAVLLPGVAARTTRVGVLRGSLLGCVLSLAAYAYAPDLLASMGALVVLGGAYVGVMTGLNTTVQLHAPLAERSRVLSLYTLGLSVSYPVGAMAQSALARVVGVRAVTVVGAGALAVVLGVLALAPTSVWPQFATPATAPSRILAD